MNINLYILLIRLRYSLFCDFLKLVTAQAIGIFYSIFYAVNTKWHLHQQRNKTCHHR